ncbi:MAG TPA: FAD-dependent oxidoreductase [Candidatus Polarisedimenticolia bacterium]|nr:FAD-dependent oxidoreductase [Candidatus Polarisedimenticolia bacterium]
MNAKVAVAGAGIYGANVAIRLAEQGHQVRLFDPLGILRATSVINQYRIHSGYHYPRSPETIRETLEARAEFMEAFAPAIVHNSRHYYAIPHEGSQTPPELFEKVMAQYSLVCTPCRPDWMNFDFIDKCYEVDEQIYDPDVLRDVVTSRIQALRIPFEQCAFSPEMRPDYDFVIWATYGLGPSRGLFTIAKYQVAEKLLIELPKELQHISLVVVDGPFTAFDPYGSSERSLFGSAKNTNHWSTTDPWEPIPEKYANLLNGPAFEPCPFTRFEAMRSDSARAVPASKEAAYVGSRFTIRVVENNPAQDRRTLYVQEPAPGELYIFSGKVVGAVKAARLVSERIAKG